MPVQDIHQHSLETSAALSSYYRLQTILPSDVITVLDAERVSFVLVGAHGIGGWTKKPRATQDVSIVVASKHLKKAVNALLRTFSNLEAIDLEVVIRLRDKDTREVAIEVMKPILPLYRATFSHAHTVAGKGKPYRIPSVEMALAMKFAAMVSPNRQDADKFLDAHDFIHIVQSNPAINLTTLEELGELVHPGGGKEILELIREVKTGEKLVF